MASPPPVQPTAQLRSPRQAAARCKSGWLMERRLHSATCYNLLHLLQNKSPFMYRSCYNYHRRRKRSKLNPSQVEATAGSAPTTKAEQHNVTTGHHSQQRKRIPRAMSATFQRVGAYCTHAPQCSPHLSRILEELAPTIRRTTGLPCILCGAYTRTAYTRSPVTL